MFSLWMKITAVFLLGLMPATAMAANMAGIVHISGNDATLDGKPCGTIVTAFAGERLSTGKSEATVTSNGTLVAVSSNTSVKLGAKSLELIEGSVVVSSGAGTATTVGNFTISTTPGVPARFVAQRANGELQMLVLAGKVDLNDGQQTEAVPATKGVKVKIPKDSTGSASTTGKLNWLHNDDIGILLVIAGGVATGVTLGIINSRSHKPASNVRP